MKAVILTGAPGPDADRADEADTRVQAQLVRAVLRAHGWKVEELELPEATTRTEAELRSLMPDLVFNLVEAIGGRGDLVPLAPELLERIGVPYTGCPDVALRATSNKPLAKRILADAGLRTPEIYQNDRESRGGDWIVKSAWEHASLGLDQSAVVPWHRVPAALAGRQDHYGGQWFAERFVDGREFNIALLEESGTPRLLPPAEIDFQAFPAGMRRIVDYAAKWEVASFAYRHTPRRFEFPAGDVELIGALGALAVRCWHLFGLRGYARVDFRVDESGRPWILEINANPCLSPDAGYMAAAARAGRDQSSVILRIVRAALTAGARPGEGTACS